MINKKGIWFVTLVCMILVLGIYYISLKDDIYKIIPKENNKNTKMTISQSDSLASLRIKNDEDILNEMNELQTILLNEESTLEEKNNAYESLQVLNTNKGKESSLEEKIQKEYQLNSFIKINGDHINVIIDSNDHNTSIVNNIMNTIQECFESKVYITVKFQ